ncbi:MAG: 1-acyl-sn-glycerol-3-phosphate acyltransferase, partial [Candidatus Borkfalkiaceae bacterium]|nr:1-acyl-sn-glycerol-3-phosphate acyltransferase [Christensenellaceae bacterium]
MQVLLIILYCLAAIVGFIVGFLLCLILFTIIVSLFADKNKTYLKHSRFYRRLLNFWTWIMTKILCIKIHVIGMEKMQNVKGRFLLVSNHRSNFDPILTWFVFKKYDVAFISKIENFSVPFFGAII